MRIPHTHTHTQHSTARNESLGNTQALQAQLRHPPTLQAGSEDYSPNGEPKPTPSHCRPDYNQ